MTRALLLLAFACAARADTVTTLLGILNPCGNVAVPSGLPKIVIYQSAQGSPPICAVVAGGMTVNMGTTPPQVTFSGGTGVPTFVTGEIPSGAIDGTNLVFTLANVPLTGSLDLYRNGLHLQGGLDYTIAGATITFIQGSQPVVTKDSQGVNHPDTLLAGYRH